MTGQFGSINMKAGKVSNFVFTFEDHTTRQQVTVPEFYFSIFDIDQRTRVTKKYGITVCKNAAYDIHKTEVDYSINKSDFCAK